MRSISRRKATFSAGFSRALKGSLDQSTVGLAADLAGGAGFAEALAATFGRAAAFLGAGTAFLTSRFFTGAFLAVLEALVTFLTATGRAVFLETGFFGLEGRESVRAMGRFPCRAFRIRKRELSRNQPHAARQKRHNQTEGRRLLGISGSLGFCSPSVFSPNRFSPRNPRFRLTFFLQHPPRARPSRPPRSRRRARCRS